MERRAVLRPKLRLEIRSLPHLKFLFLERFFVFKQCYADAEVLSASGGGDTLLVMYYRNVVPESRERKSMRGLKSLKLQESFLISAVLSQISKSRKLNTKVTSLNETEA